MSSPLTPPGEGVVAVTREGDCLRCGHPGSHHDAGECWTDGDGNEVSGGSACPCSWYEPAQPPDVGSLEARFYDGTCSACGVSYETCRDGDRCCGDCAHPIASFNMGDGDG